MSNVINAIGRFKEKKAIDSLDKLGSAAKYHVAVFDNDAYEWIAEYEDVSIIGVISSIQSIAGPLESPVQLAKSLRHNLSEVRTRENDLHSVFIPVGQDTIEFYIHRVH